MQVWKWLAPLPDVTQKATQTTPAKQREKVSTRYWCVSPSVHLGTCRPHSPAVTVSLKLVDEQMFLVLWTSSGT